MLADMDAAQHEIHVLYYIWLADETGTRTAPMAGGDVELRMRHCEAGGLTAAVGQATLRAGQAPGPVLDQWRLATLASLRANQSRETPWAMAGAAPLPQSRRVEAAGLDAQGGAPQHGLRAEALVDVVDFDHRRLIAGRWVGRQDDEVQ